jgi:hypothetical protein
MATRILATMAKIVEILYFWPRMDIIFATVSFILATHVQNSVYFWPRPILATVIAKMLVILATQT